MKRQLKIVINKLYSHPISSLSPDELGVYFDHRLEKLVHDKKVLTRNEITYLLSETGPGNRRIDPRLIPLRVKEGVLVSPLYESFPEIQQLKEKKIEVEQYLLINQASEKTKELITKQLGKYLRGCKIVSKDQFIIEASLEDIQVSCMIRNGGWIFPDKELFSFLKSVQEQKRFPIVIAKKISGILFPVFKGLSVLGLNLYRTILPEEAEKLITNSVNKPKEKFFPELRYNDQFQFLTDEYVNNIDDDYWEGDPLKNFFEHVLPSNIATYSASFTNSKIKIADNFVDTVSQFRKNKATRALIEYYKAQEKLLGM